MSDSRKPQKQPRSPGRRRRTRCDLSRARALDRSAKTPFQLPLRRSVESVVGVVVRARPPGSIGIVRAEVQTEPMTKRGTSDFDPEVVHGGNVAVDGVVLHEEEDAAAAHDLVPAHGERLETFAHSSNQTS